MTTLHDQPTATTETMAPEPAGPRFRSFLVPAGGGRIHRSPRLAPLPAIEVKLGGDQGAPFSVMEYEAPAGFAPPPVLHRHTREFGAVYVLDGELTYWFEDGVERRASAGTLVVMGTGWFRWANRTDAAAKMLCIFSPAGFEQFFVDIHDAMRDADDMAAFGGVLTRLRMAYGDESYPD